MKIKDEIIQLAISQARKSPMMYRHGSVVFKNNKIIGAGYNWNVHPPSDDKRPFSIHSERDALKGLHIEQMYGADLICVRITPTEKLASSKPCNGCMKLLKRKNLSSVFWFDSEENLNRTYLR